MRALGTGTVTELAELLGLFPGTLGSLIEDVHLTPLVSASGTRRYRLRDVEAKLSRQVLAAARRADREARLAVRTSKYWLSGYPKLAAQWHPTRNGDLFPDEVRYQSRARIWWKCPAGDDHEWCVPAFARTDRPDGTDCPFCLNRRLSKTNSIATVRPDLAAQWHPKRNGKRRPHDAICGGRERHWWICPAAPDHEWQASVLARLKGGACPYCVKRGAWTSSTNSLATRHPEIAREWHPTRNRPLTPADVSSGSAKIVWWRCALNRKHEWPTKVYNRTQDNTACPFCSNKKVSSDNCLKARFPRVAREWHPTRNGRMTPKDVMPGTVKRVWWRCSRQPRHVWQATVYHRAIAGTGCPRCLDRASRTG